MKENDISKQRSSNPSRIDRVGLNQVELPFQLEWEGGTQNVTGSVRAMVSLDDPHLRGIHMSRVYLLLYEFSTKKVVHLENLKKLLYEIKDSQKGTSFSSSLVINWKGGLVQKALSSSHKGILFYPCFYELSLSSEGEFDFIQGASIYYSSTCPCSAALSRELIQEEFQKSKVQTRSEMQEWLSHETSIAGVPHAQRSRADFKIRASKVFLPYVIRSLEKTLVTGVQGAVKKEDEKQFAHLNSQNLLYTEDAIRRIKSYLEKESSIQSYWARVSHFESLHPFDTIAQVSKNWK